MTTIYISVAGTNGLHKKVCWWKPESPFSKYLDSLGLVLAKSEPFYWSTDLNGLDLAAHLFHRAECHDDWEAGGHALKYFLENVDPGDRNIISHSHGRQVVLYAASQGLKINNWLDISGPVRQDILDITLKAEGKINHSLHVYSPFDYIQILGSLLDGTFGLRVTCPISENLKLTFDCGHSNLLYDPSYFTLFESLKLIDFLRRDANVY